jgi:integrase
MAGHIVKRGEKTWMVRIFLGRDGKGKRRYLNKTIRGTKKKVNEYLSKTLTDISAGTFVQSSADSVEDYLEKWLETAARPRLRENTYREYKGLIQRYVKPALGRLRLSDLRPLDVQNSTQR